MTHHRLLALLILGLGAMFALVPATDAAPTVIADDLAAALGDAGEQDLLPVVIHMHPAPDPDALYAAVAGLSREEARMLVWDMVTDIATTAQADLLDYLDDEVTAERAHDLQPLMAGNAIAVEIPPATVRAISQRSDVRVMIHDPARVAIDPIEGEPVTSELDEIVYGVDLVGAPDVWDMGYTGEGVVVAVLDTGVNYNHLDLEDHMWDGGQDYPNHGWNFSYDTDDPFDDHSHGTHVAGTVASDGTAGTQAGIAPDARIMALKIFNSWGSGDMSDAWAALDFAMDNGADVVTMSAGWHEDGQTEQETYRNYYVTLAAMGIAAVNSAGNDGDSIGTYPPPFNIKLPARVPPPWLGPYQDEPGEAGGLMTIGATDEDDDIAYFSSIGPVTWEDVSPWNDFLYDNGNRQGLLKPDLSGPGVDIISCDNDSNTGYSTKSGTSMSTPLAAGVCALMLSINDDLTPAELNMILENTSVDLGAAGKDVYFGAGRIDAYAAAQEVEATLSPVIVRLHPQYEPYIVPSGGGTMYFDAELISNVETPTPGQAWIDVLLPNGNTYHVASYNFMFQPDTDTLFEDLSQVVPGGAPNGIYQFIARAGQYPNVVVTEDSFEFRKFSFDPDGDTAFPRPEIRMPVAAD